MERLTPLGPVPGNSPDATEPEGAAGVQPVGGTNLDADELYATIDQDNWWEPMADTFPVGTVIIHESVDREQAHGVEVKRDDYVDERGRPWWLGMVFDDGTLDTGYGQPRADCHNPEYRVTAGLWGIPASAK